MDYKTGVETTARALGIILGGFISMVVGFTAIATVIGPVGKGAELENLMFLRWIVLALPLLEVPVILQIWMTFGRRIQGEGEWPQRIAALRARTIVTGALVEAPALLAAVSIMLTGFHWQAIPALVLFAGGMAALFPTPARIKSAIGNEDGSKVDQYS